MDIKNLEHSDTSDDVPFLIKGKRKAAINSEIKTRQILSSDN